MPGTYSHLVYHITFSTKRRLALISPQLQARLYPFIGGIVRDGLGVLFTIGGMPDHVHLLVRWRTDEALATLLRHIKSRSSSWVHQTFPDVRDFAWQEGYAAFTVSKSVEPEIVRYIENQEEHHRNRDFRDELLAFLRAHEIEVDERYVFD